MGSIDGALPNLSGAGSFFARVPIDLSLATSQDLLRKLPGAARTVFQAIHVLLKQGREIDTTDREFARLCGIGRRCVQKGLKQLEDIGVISRLRQHGGRIITFLVSFATKAAKKVVPTSGRKPDKPQPAAVPAATKPVEPEPTVSEEEAREAAAALQAELRGAIDPKPHVTVPGPTEASRRPGTIGAIVVSPPIITDEEKIRRTEESKQRALAALAARKQAKGQERPEVPPAPSGAGEAARE